MTRIAFGLALTILAAVPAAARDAYDCKDHAGIPPDARWSPTNEQMLQAIHDFYAKFASPQEKFNVRMCGVSEGGKQVMLVDALLADGSKELCGDAPNFAVLYDPETHEFADKVAHEKLCPAAPKAP